MRNLIFLIVISAFLIWFGLNFRHIKRSLAISLLIIGCVLALLAVVGMFRLV